MSKRYIENYYPVGQTVALLVNGTEGNLLNEYNWGGYLAWEQDRYPVFIDARTDLYGDEIFEDWLTLILMKDNWGELLNKYNIGAVMLQVDRPLVEELVIQGWEIVQHDEIGILLIR